MGSSGVAVGNCLQWFYLKDSQSVPVGCGKTVLEENFGEKTKKASEQSGHIANLELFRVPILTDFQALEGD